MPSENNDANYHRHRIKIEYNGKIYTRLSDLAKAASIPASKLNERWQLGIRSLHDLLYDGDLSTINQGKIPIDYHDHHYESLREFARAYKLSYDRLREFIRLGVSDTDALIELSKTQNNVKIIKDISDNDYKAIERFLNARNLLTTEQVSLATGLSKQALYELTNRITIGQSNNSGVQEDDVVEVTEPPLPELVNPLVMPKRAFKPAVIDHIKAQQDNKSAMVLIPFENNNYYYEPKSKTVWGYRKASHALKRLTPYPKDTYTFRDNLGKRKIFSLRDIEDIIANPDITADQLITKQALMQKYGLTKYMYNNRKIWHYLLLSAGHSRYNKDGKKVSGWLKSEIELVAYEHPELFKRDKK